MSKKLYSLTDEHRAELKPWADKWIANAMSTEGMTDDDRVTCKQAVKDLYKAADLTSPPDNRIIFVASPYALRFAGGFAAAIWYMRKNAKAAKEIGGFTEAGFVKAVEGIVKRGGVKAAIARATYEAVSTDGMPALGTSDAVGNTVGAAFSAAATSADLALTNVNYHNADIDMLVELSNELGIGKFGLLCAERSYSIWQGGNQWSAWDSMLSFFKEIVQLPLDYSKYESWLTLARRSGPRIVHEDFCIVSDRPELLTVDGSNRPHGETAPFSRWRDGFSIYALNGVYVPQWAIETPRDKIDPKKILGLENTEQRYVLMRHVGLHNFLGSLRAKVLHEYEGYRLMTLTVEGSTIGPYLYMKCPSSGREFLEGVGDPTKFESVDTSIKTCQDALTWRAQKASNDLMTKFNLKWDYHA